MAAITNTHGLEKRKVRNRVFLGGAFCAENMAAAPAVVLAFDKAEFHPTLVAFRNRRVLHPVSCLASSNKPPLQHRTVDAASDHCKVIQKLDNRHSRTVHFSIEIRSISVVNCNQMCPIPAAL